MQNKNTIRRNHMLIDKCLLDCERRVLKKSPTIYYCFKDLPLAKKYSVYVLYSFCFEIKKIIDGDNGAHKLDKLESKLLEFQNEKNINDPLWKGLRKVFNVYDMSIQPFKDMINAKRFDLKQDNMISMNDLLEYCYYAGSSKGFMLMPILERDKLSSDDKTRLKDVVSDIWRGLCLINILKDLNYDLKKERIFIPDLLFLRFKYSIDDFKKGIINDNFINIWEYIASYAVNYISSAEENLDVFSIDCVESVKLMIQDHKMILDEIRINRYNYSSASFDIIRSFKRFNVKLAPSLNLK